MLERKGVAMENLKGKSTKTILSLLYDNFYNYYWDVYFEYINEAIENTKKDFSKKDFYNIEDIHKNIIENYI